MKQVIRSIRNTIIINKIVSSLLIFFQKLLGKIINYWPISGSRKYSILNIPITLDAKGDDGFVNRLYYNRGYDEKVLDVFKYLVLNGNKVIYDIGANIGIFSLLAGTINKDNIIYAFEPNPVNFKRLLSNIKSNDLPNVNPYKIAIGNNNKSLLLTKPKGNYISDVTSVYSNHTKRFTDFDHEKFSVVQICLDDFVIKEEIQNPDIIKLDVELYEYEVLLGSKKIIEKCRPIILCELHNYSIVTGINSLLKEEIKYNFTEKISSFFKDLNYHAFAIGEFGLLQVSHFEEMINVKNYLFLPHMPNTKFYTFNQLNDLIKK